MRKKTKYFNRFILFGLFAFVFTLSLSCFFTAQAESAPIVAKLTYISKVYKTFDFETQTDIYTKVYTVTGIDEAWAESLSAEEKKNIIIKIPAKYKAEEDTEPCYVMNVAENAFRMSSEPGDGFITDYKIIGLDLSEAKYLSIIEKFAFMGTDITKLDFSNILLYEFSRGLNIGESAFENCKKLTEIELCSEMSNVIVIKSRAFANCASIKLLDLSDKPSLTSWNNKFGILPYDDAFIGCTGLKTVYLSDTVVHYGEFFDETVNPANIVLSSVPHEMQFKESVEKIKGFYNFAIFEEFFTFEKKVDFYLDETNKITEKKLYNRPFNMVKQSDGSWQVDENYQLPFISENEHMKWVVASGKEVLATDIVGDDIGFTIKDFTPPLPTITPPSKPNLLWLYITLPIMILLLGGLCLYLIKHNKQKRIAMEAAGKLIQVSDELVMKEEEISLKENEITELKQNARITELPEELKSLLTTREQEVALLILQHKTRETIAKMLHITLATSKAHASNILSKTYCKTSSEFREKYIK